MEKDSQGSVGNQLEEWNSLYRTDIVKFFHRKLTSSSEKESIEDLVQEVFARAQRTLNNSSKGAVHHPKKWLLQIAHYVSTEYMATRIKERNRFATFPTYIDEDEVNPYNPVDESSDASPEYMALVNERSQQLWEGISKLSVREKKVAIAHCIEEREIKEISQREGRSIGAVYKDLRNSLQHLNGFLHDLQN